ncbi:MAG: hypothetical protein ACFCBW_04820 [Candidatus Competibacterales bacterium]
MLNLARLALLVGVVCTVCGLAGFAVLALDYDSLGLRMLQLVPLGVVVSFVALVVVVALGERTRDAPSLTPPDQDD